MKEKNLPMCTMLKVMTLFLSAKRFFSGTMLSRLSGLIRDIAMARAFGTSSAVAALLVAFRLSHLLRRLLGEGAMQTAFIPRFELIRKKSPQEGAEFFIDLYFTTTCLLFLLISASMLFCAYLTERTTFSEGNQLIVHLTGILMPGLLFICLFGLNAALLQCEKSFFLSAFAPVFFNVAWTLGILLSENKSPEKAMSWLALSIVFGCFLQWAYTLPKTISALRPYVQRKMPNLLNHELLAMGKPLILGIFAIGGAQINSALDPLFARWADVEGPAYLWFAVRLHHLPLALFGIAIANALLPPLSQAAAEKNRDQFCNLLETALTQTCLVMIPIMFGTFILARPAIALLYGYNDFGMHSVEEVTLCLYGYIAGLIPMALTGLLAPAFYAEHDYKTPTRATLFAVLANIFLNTLCVFGLGLGAAAIAAATSMAAWANFFYLAIAMKKKGLFSFTFALYTMIARATFLSLGSFLFVYAARNYLAFPCLMGLLFLERALWFSLEAGLFFSPFIIYSYLNRRELAKLLRI